MIPDGKLATVHVPGWYPYPDDRRPIAPPLPGVPRDWERGGIALNDATYGLEVQVWQFFLEGDAIMVKPERGKAIILYTPGAGVTEVTGCFDSNMNPTIAWVQNGASWMRWWDPTIPGYRLSSLPGLVSPRLTLDDKRARQDARRDVLLFYIRNRVLYYRMQRERYQQENWLLDVPQGYHLIGRVGMNNNLRVQIELISRDLT